ncbi:alpha/beta-hydrolase [Auricularia subglabra TFB-10046 SS5]|nr:alpha/beta-hydrolase [Auricularia subglabra TFB-10046 SS5]
MAAASALAAAESALPPARPVPDSFKASVKAWWAAGEKESALAEERLLRRLPYFYPKGTPVPSPPPPVTVTVDKVTLDAKRYINTISFTPSGPAPADRAPPPTVVMHGYGAGAGFYFMNFETFGKWAGRRGSPVFLLDWLGMGRSARVPFEVKAKKTDIDGRVREAESFFIDSLEQWREKMQLPKMTLVGHSLGAYLSVAYALRHPDRVSRLILLSPAGVPRGPDDTSLPSAEVDPSPHGDGAAHAASREEAKKIEKEQRRAARNQNMLRRVGLYLWEEGFSPFQVVRTAGMWGPMLVGKYSSRRFIGLTEEETREMNEYIFNITVAKGSSEYCISHILAPGAHARRPLVDRVDKLKIPVTFVYGDHDWMDPTGGTESVKALNAAGNQDAKMYIIPNAGHHVYLDNPRAVNDLIVRELDKGVPRQ